MPCEHLSQTFLDAAIKARFAHVRVKSKHFVGLHAFYKGVYESMEGWFDRFAERARAEEEKTEEFNYDSIAVEGDQIAHITEILTGVKDEVIYVRKKEDPTTQAICDEALEDIEKFLWQLRMMA